MMTRQRFGPNGGSESATWFTAFEVLIHMDKHAVMEATRVHDQLQDVLAHAEWVLGGRERGACRCGGDQVSSK